MNTIAALFVKTNGVYFGLDGVEPWDIRKDATKYSDHYPVVAHPPCTRWSTVGAIHSGVVTKDDGGLFDFALSTVRRCGGVLEHPALTTAWTHYGLPKPSRIGGWIKADSFGYTCCIEQGNYGFLSRKPTFLYAVGVDAMPIKWGESRARYQIAGRRGPHVPKSMRDETPTPFRDLLIAMARSVYNDE